MGSKKGHLCPELILSDISASHLAHLSQDLGALLIFKGTSSPKPEFPEGHFVPLIILH